MSEVKLQLQVQSLKRSTFSFFCAFTAVRSPCIHLQSTLRSICASLSQSAQSALTKHSQSFQRSLIVQSVFIWNSKMKDSIFESHEKMRKENVRKSGRNLNTLHIQNIILIKIQSVQFKVHIFEQVRFCCCFLTSFLNRSHLIYVWNNANKQ